MANSIDPDEMALLRAISSGSMLFADIVYIVTRSDWANLNMDFEYQQGWICYYVGDKPS